MAKTSVTNPSASLCSSSPQALNDLVRYLLDRFAGNFVDLVEAAGSSYEQLMRLLVEMPYFKDVELYDKLEVPFYERAQLTVADLSVAFEKKGPGHSGDLDRLAILADKLIPHVLRVDGVCSTKNLWPPASTRKS